MILRDIEMKVMSELKDFQRATVDRCFDLFTTTQRRVLVADEVGLGKTLIAKGIISRLASNHKQNGKQFFKVLYICSNTSIANQNIRKLKIHGSVTVDGVTDTRLSMQHLKIFEQENDLKVRNGFIHLIPLTPATSFSLTRGAGDARERALIYSILKRLPEFQGHSRLLHSLFIQNATSGFQWCVDEMEGRIKKCNADTKGEYLRTIIAEVKGRLTPQQVQRVMNKDYYVIAELRMMFAQISINRLKPDLVIMDEFQRFRELIAVDTDTETGLLTNAFLHGSETNTLLLSATPYKLYQTLEEAANSGVDEHYREFLQLVEFLFDDKEKYRQFHETWNDFSISLREADAGFATIINIKKKAEHELYSGMCRTERLLVETTGKSTDDSGTKKPVEISDADIHSFIQAEMLSDTVHVPVEYVKSCPYLLSFMEQYKFKHDVKRQRPDFNNLSKKMLFMDERKLKRFTPLPSNNARLERLMEVALENGAERLLWVPPSIPYYPLGGVFKRKDNFSKILVFSAWEMVPRMIACTLSYECERRTIGQLYAKEQDKRFKGYLIEDDEKQHRRFPTPRFAAGRDKTLTTVSAMLASLYDPVEHMGKTLGEIKKHVKALIQPMLDYIKREYNVPDKGTTDMDWYWIAPTIFDSFLVEKGQKIIPNVTIPQRKMPSDILDVLANMAIASPAICALRVFDKNTEGLDKLFSDNKRLAKQFATEIVSMFDKPEAIAVVELAYGKSDDAHYKNVLKYCLDGNFAAMLDEYAHMLNDQNPVSLCGQMCDALKTSTASYPIDTYTSFTGDRKNQIRMRSHYAAGFYQTRSDAKTVQRKDHLRTAFNSPFRPFVLATTSIGQEGLDFHNYARKIMHWNLPHNPIDLEQREGRINRYKCLAIRQSLAQTYRDHDFENDVWNKLFQLALDAKAEDEPELIPYWCLPDGGSVKIERIVPMYPYSKDRAVYERLLKILSLYRITMGQARQEELLEYLFNNDCDIEELQGLFINLSPITKE